MKLIPFKCRFNHVSIKEFSKELPTPTEIICDQCIRFNERINNGDEMFRYFNTATGNIKRGGAMLTRKIPDGEKAYRY